MTIVRRVLDHEYPKYRQHLKALDADSKVMRFANPLSDQAIDNIFDKWEQDHANNVLFCVENDRLEFVAVGHVAFHNGEMELAFSVLKDYQGQGMGTALMKRVISWCRTHRHLKGCMVCLSTNAAIRHLCIKHGIHVHNDHGETLANIELDSPNITTYLAEAADSNLATMDYLGKRMSPLRFTSKSD